MSLELLRAAIKASSKQAVADKLECSRTTVSLIDSGKYPARTDRIMKRVMEVYGRVQCPFLLEEISNEKCREYSSREAPTSSPFAMRHWRACQSCPNKGKL